MSTSVALSIIQKQWQNRFWQKVGIWVLMVLTYSLISHYYFQWPKILILPITVIGLYIIYLEWRSVPDLPNIILWLNKDIRIAEFSTGLLVSHSPNTLENLQKNRIESILVKHASDIKLPFVVKNLVLGMSMLITLSLVVIAINSKLKFNQNSELFTISDSTTVVTYTDLDSIYLRDLVVNIQPPSYTNLSRVRSTDRSITCPAGSVLWWDLHFEGKPDFVKIITSEGDSLVNGRGQGLKKSVNRNGFYSVQYLNHKNEVVNTPFYEIIVIEDEQPLVTIDNMPQHQKMDYKSGIKIPIHVNFEDDYGITDGFIIATITKGSGESVKFREQKINFSKKVYGKKISRTWIADLDQLEMQPGNELYFYAVAVDNNSIPSVVRTETFFIVLADTTQTDFSLQGALGVDLMPEYFRSQLQIIIDTEQLIKDFNKLDRKEFNSRSNLLGYDQKQLRIKYGQFIGEEDESGLDHGNHEGPNHQESHDDHDHDHDHDHQHADEVDVLAEYGHDTDHEHEDGAWMDKGTTVDKNPLTEYMHLHDDAETATFYTQTLKDKLKAALNEMWQSELYLRLYEPKKSLPYQYKAQELLKEIRNHARIYVQRIGFEPPPVNVAEARLTGKLKDVNQKQFSTKVEQEVDYPAIRRAIPMLDKLELGLDLKMEDAKNILKNAGNELAGLAIEKPGEYLNTLNLLRQLMSTTDNSKIDRIHIRHIKDEFVTILSKSERQFASQFKPDDEYTQKFVNAIIRMK